MKPVLTLVLSLVLAACASSPRPQPPVGTGWSRASDVSVYGAMELAGRLAREQQILCAGRNPAEVAASWQAQFGEREAWIEAALTNIYGPAALIRERLRTDGRTSCPTFGEERWVRHHRDLLRLLELRLYPSDYWAMYPWSAG